MIVRRFPCTPGGAILRGRRRLRTLLVGLAVLMLAVALAAGVARRIGPALVALAVALVPWTAWRMSGDLDPFWLETGDGWLGVQMRRRRERFNIAGFAGAQGRRLTAGEIAHLETLATSGDPDRDRGRLLLTALLSRRLAAAGEPNQGTKEEAAGHGHG